MKHTKIGADASDNCLSNYLHLTNLATTAPLQQNHNMEKIMASIKLS